MQEEQITQLSILGVVSIVGLIASIALLTPGITSIDINEERNTVVGQSSFWDQFSASNTNPERTNSENTYYGEPQTSSQSQAQTFSQNLLQTVQNEEITVEIPVCIEKVAYLTQYEDEIIEDAYRIAETVAGNQGIFLERVSNSNDCVEIVFADMVSYVALTSGWGLDEQRTIEKRNTDIEGNTKFGSDILTNRRPEQKTYYYYERETVEDELLGGDEITHGGFAIQYDKSLILVNGEDPRTAVSNMGETDEHTERKEQAFQDLFAESLARMLLHEVGHNRGLIHVWDLPILSEQQQGFARSESVTAKRNLMSYSNPRIYDDPTTEEGYTIDRHDSFAVTGAQRYIMQRAQDQNTELYSIMQNQNPLERTSEVVDWYDEHLTEDMQRAYSAGIEEIVTGRTTAQNNFFN